MTITTTTFSDVWMCTISELSFSCLTSQGRPPAKEKPPSDTDTIVYNASDDPTAMAIAMLLDQGRNVPLWDDCRFIWDSASLLSSAAAESEMYVFGVEGKSTAPDGTVEVFRMRHHVDFAGGGKHGIRVVRKSLEGSKGLLDAELQAASAEHGQRVFEEAVRAMTDRLKAMGQRRALEILLSCGSSPSDGANEYHGQLMESWTSAAKL